MLACQWRRAEKFSITANTFDSPHSASKVFLDSYLGVRRKFNQDLTLSMHRFEYVCLDMI